MLPREWGDEKKDLRPPRKADGEECHLPYGHGVHGYGSTSRSFQMAMARVLPRGDERMTPPDFRGVIRTP